MRLAAAFRASRYEAAGCVLRVGRRDGVEAVLAALGAAEAVLITAWNPGGRRHAPRWNRRAARALARRLHAAALPAASGLGRWREEMLAVALPWRPACALARRFRQAAILALRRHAPARLLWCRAA